MNKTIQFNASIEEVSKINPLFSKCNIKVLYTGGNRNNTFIAKETVDRAIGSIYNIPIVGEFIEQKEDFGSHGGKVEISDQGIKFVQTTKPYGVVPESAKVYWQPIAEADGIVHEYLIVEGAYLWTGRYAETMKMVDNAKGQSMEIEILSGDFNKEDLFVIDDMNFSALCILGDGVEPCFESASISAYNLKDFKQEFTTMMKELKASLTEKGDDVENKSKEGESMQEKLELLSKYSFTEEMAVEKGINLAEVSVEELKVKLAEFIEESSEDAAEAEVDATKEFDVETEVESEFQAEAEVTENTTEVDFSVKEQEYLAKISTLEASLDAVSKERDELADFKKKKMKAEHQVQVEELFAKFNTLTDEDTAEVREQMFDLTLEQVEEKLFTILGKKAAAGTFSLNSKKKESVKIDLDFSEMKDKGNGYELEHLFERYADK